MKKKYVSIYFPNKKVCSNKSARMYIYIGDTNNQHITPGSNVQIMEGRNKYLRVFC